MGANLLTSKKAMTFRNELYGIAAIWIILFHVAMYTNPVRITSLCDANWGGQLAVNKIFNIISRFIITALADSMLGDSIVLLFHIWLCQSYILPGMISSDLTMVSDSIC